MRRLVTHSVLLLSGLLAVTVPGAGASASLVRSEQVSVAFFSSVTEAEFARLETAWIAPASRRHGPFTVPAAGLAVDPPVLHLLDLRCQAGDWETVLGALDGWNRLPAAEAPRLGLPDGRLFAFIRRPFVRSGALFGIVRQLPGDPAAPEPIVHALQLRHDAAGLLVPELRALPARFLAAPVIQDEAGPNSSFPEPEADPATQP